jgi:predicted HicB family RNase H-like nuclease
MNEILQYKGYSASIHFSHKDKVLYGKVLGIDDLVNFEGSSIKRLKMSFYEAVEDYLETCKELDKAHLKNAFNDPF